MSGKEDGPSPLERQRARMTELFETVRYSPTLPEGTVVDEHGLPVIEGDDEDDEWGLAPEEVDEQDESDQA
jgi:hypothetical protein